MTPQKFKDLRALWESKKFMASIPREQAFELLDEIDRLQAESDAFSANAVALEVKHLEDLNERDRLKGELEKANKLKELNDWYERFNQECLRADAFAVQRDSFKTLAGELAEALKAQIQMRDMKKPTKLEEELSWRENDELAAKMGEEALAAYDKAVKGI